MASPTEFSEVSVRLAYEQALAAENDAVIAITAKKWLRNKTHYLGLLCQGNVIRIKASKYYGNVDTYMFHPQAVAVIRYASQAKMLYVQVYPDSGAQDWMISDIIKSWFPKVEDEVHLPQS